MANEHESPPVTASVVYLRLHDATTDAERLPQTVRTAAASWNSDARVVLDAADGAAIVGLGDPLLALHAAQRAAAAGELRVGLHHGPVQLIESSDGGPARLQGEGISGAAAAARQASEALVFRTDAFQAALAAARQQRQRRAVICTAGIVGLLALGGVANLVRQGIDAARRPAMISLDVKPFGEVYVDGELKGVSPPLNRMWIPAGAHTIELRNSRFKPLHMDVELKSGEELEIKHSFANPSRRKGWLDRWKFW